MRLRIEAEDQREFDSKREDLIRSLAGQKFDVEITPRAKEPKSPAQREMLAYWNQRYLEMIEGLKEDLTEILG